MNMKIAALAGAVVSAVIGIATIAHVNAHHAFAAEFDADAPVRLEGKVTKIQFINPHSWIHVAAEEEDGTTTDWMVEGGTPNTLLRNGITRNSLPIGTEVIVRGYQSKDRLCEPKCKANGRDITLANGEKVFMGSSGAGAPPEDAKEIE